MYQKPNMELVGLDETDIIRTSGGFFAGEYDENGEPILKPSPGEGSWGSK